VQTPHGGCREQLPPEFFAGIFAEVKRLLPVPNAGGEGLEVTRTLSNKNRKK